MLLRPLSLRGVGPGVVHHHCGCGLRVTPTTRSTAAAFPVGADMGVLRVHGVQLGDGRLAERGPGHYTHAVSHVRE